MDIIVDNIINSGSVALTLTADANINPYGITTNNIVISRYDTDGYTIIPINAFSVIDNKLYLYISPLLPNKLHIIELFNIPSLDDINVLIQYKILRFLSVDSVPIANVNNAYTKLTKLYDILDLENVLLNKIDQTLIFKPSTYNTNTNQFEEAINQVTISNSDALIDLILNQYYDEYKVFYKNISQRDSIKQSSAISYTDDYVNKFNLYMMKNHVKFSALKGTQFLIQLYLALYSKYLGQFLISVVEDTSHNFVYYVSSSISEQFWNTNIKPYVHPLSWSCIYNEISGLSTNLIQTLDLKKSILQKWMANWDSNKFINYRATTNRWYNDNTISIGSFSNESRFNTLSCTIDNDYNFNNDMVNFIQEFDTPPISGDSLFTISNTTSGTNYIVNAIYNRPGLAYKYVWYIRINDVMLYEITTYFNDVTFTIPTIDWASTSIAMKMIYKNGEYFLSNKAKN